MRQYVALMYKEWLETRHISFGFLIGGLVGLHFYYITLKMTRTFALDIVGLFVFFTLLNLATLCACAFARERQNGTSTILRRIAADWRVAATAKFGYAILSSALFALIFTAISGVIDLRLGFPFGSSIVDYFKSFNLHTSDAAFLKGLGLAFVACWGVFWTGRTDRVFVVLALSFLTPTLTSIVVAWLCTYWEYDWQAPTIICNAVASLLALTFAPFPGRFGYRQS